jgi:hypothetical protein
MISSTVETEESQRPHRWRNSVTIGSHSFSASHSIGSTAKPSQMLIAWAKPGTDPVGSKTRFSSSMLIRSAEAFHMRT